MGLDMYAMTTKKNLNQSIEFEIPDDSAELHYWRKHPDLHGWMEELYYSKGGRGAFNCVPVVLTESDLDHLEAAVVHDELPSTEGLFFGRSLGDEYDDDLKFIAKARKAIADGYTVFYDSWW